MIISLAVLLFAGCSIVKTSPGGENTGSPDVPGSGTENAGPETAPETKEVPETKEAPETKETEGEKTPPENPYQRAADPAVRRFSVDPVPAANAKAPSGCDSLPPLRGYVLLCGNNNVDFYEISKQLELPVIGASGYASIKQGLYDSPFGVSEEYMSVTGTKGRKIAELSPGDGFTIIGQYNGCWLVRLPNGKRGFVDHSTCLINLPDVIPSIVYNITNASSSVFSARGYAIENVTGEKFYDGYLMNKRLERAEYLAPVLYKMAFKICAAQHAAISDGNTFVLYEGYRPAFLQDAVRVNLTKLMAVNETVKEGITAKPWSITWFISMEISNHQRGYAIDTTIAKLFHRTKLNCGSFIIYDSVSYSEYKMQTGLQDLSYDAAIFTKPVPSRTDDWKKAEIAPNASEYAVLLQKYCTDAGLSPLASEWWHFNDLDLQYSTSVGDYVIDKCWSEKP